jgi:hypothetical protein
MDDLVMGARSVTTRAELPGMSLIIEDYTGFFLALILGLGILLLAFFRMAALLKARREVAAH